MIFSTDKCPICNGELKMDVIQLQVPKKVAFSYSCSTQVSVRNDTDTETCSIAHYSCLNGLETEMCFMVIPPFSLTHHSDSNKQITVVRKVRAHETAKLIFETQLLDWDYSDPQAVVARLKKLVPFS